MKSLGCVLTRIAHTPQSTELLNYCDEVGMLLIAENPVWSKFDPNAFSNSPVAKQWNEEMIIRDFNHPSIIAWSVANEIGIDEHWTDMRMSKEQFRYVSSMLHYIKTSLDSTRLLTYASFTAFREKANKDTDPAGLCDFISFNSYGDIADNCLQIHSKWPDKPIFITEFGRGMIGENLNTSDIVPVVYQLMDKAKNFPYLMGASLWTYNDYRSRYKGTPPSENRAWGVVDVWRNPKIATRSIRELFSPVKNFTVNLSGSKLEVTLSGNGMEDLPNTSVENYFIRIQTEKEVLTIESLNQFKTKDNNFRATINLTKHKLNGNFLEVCITTPGGFAVAEKRIALKKFSAPFLLHSDANDEKMQVRFSKAPAASGYILHYNERRIPLIEPFFELPIDKNTDNHLIAIEVYDDNGQTCLSKTYKITSTGGILPPVIQHVEKVYNGYVVGFTVDQGDEWIEILYKTKDGKEIVKSGLKGSFKINETKQIMEMSIRKSNKGMISDWSVPHVISISE
jgi:hypothetical protein